QQFDESEGRFAVCDLRILIAQEGRPPFCERPISVKNPGSSTPASNQGQQAQRNKDRDTRLGNFVPEDVPFLENGLVGGVPATNRIKHVEPYRADLRSQNPGG